MATAVAVMLSGMTGMVTPAASGAVQNALVTSSSGAFRAAGALSPQSLASLADGHLCWLFSNGSDAPRKYDAYNVSYTDGFQCDGGVRKIQFTIELIYNGVTGDTGSVVASKTVSTLTNPTTSLMAGVYVQGASCPPGYYSGRITGTVDFRSGTPLTITRTFTTRQAGPFSCSPVIG
ncbi:hypothetical protein [Microbispora bryophytorum]|uniref:hypothetical protein n=1 Tax=Microbispora bryophytorum TaxID=1460882 RepID=UPI00371EE1A1